MGQRQDNRQGGTCYLKINGTNFEITQKLNASVGGIQREGKQSLQGTSGYKETKTLRYIDTRVSLPPGVSVDDIEEITDATVIGEAANGWDHTLTNAWCTAAIEVDGVEGEADVRFEGLGGFRTPPS